MKNSHNKDRELWSIHRFSSVFDVDDQTLKKKVYALHVEAAGASSTKDKDPLYRPQDLLKAYLGGDERMERLRKVREEADKIALDNEKTRGRLVEVDAVVKWAERIFVGIRQKILASTLPELDKDGILIDLQSLKQTGKFTE